MTPEPDSAVAALRSDRTMTYSQEEVLKLVSRRRGVAMECEGVITVVLPGNEVFTSIEVEGPDWPAVAVMLGMKIWNQRAERVA